MPQIQGQRPLAAAEAHLSDHQARLSLQLGRLDPHHVGSEVGELHGAIAARRQEAEIEYPDALEGCERHYSANVAVIIMAHMLPEDRSRGDVVTARASSRR